MDGSIKLGRIGSIPVAINYTWFVVFAVLLWMLATNYFPTAYPDWTKYEYWVVGLIATVLFFSSVLLHELGHSFVAMRSGIPIRRITLFVFGGVAQLEREPDSPGSELKIALAGPVVSFLLAGVFFTLTLSGVNYVAAVARYVMLINLILGGFNLLPGYPLDGGRVFRSGLWWFTGSLHRATRYASLAGQVIAFAFIGIGLLGLLSGVLFGLWWIFIGWFLFEGARSGLQHVIIRSALGDIMIRDIMAGQVIVISPQTSVAQAVDTYFLKHDQGGFPVVDNKGQLLGVVTLEDVRDTEPEKRLTTTVGEIMTPHEQLKTLAPTDTCLTALMQMAELGVGRLPVLQRGQLVGLVSRDHLITVLRLRTDNNN